MAETKSTKQQSAEEPKAPDTEKTTPEQPQEPPAEQPKARARSASTGGTEYVVIADQFVTKQANGRHGLVRRGGTVTLPEDQAARYLTGTRPALVPAADVGEGGVDRAAVVALRSATERRVGRRRGGNPTTA